MRTAKKRKTQANLYGLNELYKSPKRTRSHFTFKSTPSSDLSYPECPLGSIPNRRPFLAPALLFASSVQIPILGTCDPLFDVLA